MRLALRPSTRLEVSGSGMKLRTGHAGSPRPLVLLRARRLALYLGLAAVAAAFCQLILGAPLGLVAVALVAALLGLFGFVVLGGYNLASWVALFYALGNVLVALYAKTLLLQPLDSHLYAPLHSFLAIGATSAALLIALLLVRYIWVGRPIFRPIHDPHLLGFISWVCLMLGTAFWMLNRFFQDPGAVVLVAWPFSDICCSCR